MRVDGGNDAHWQLSGLDLPAQGRLRARARTAGGIYNGSSGLVESVVDFSGLLPPAPEISVEQPEGPPLTSGMGTVAFAVVSNTSKTFVVRNSGSATLTGLTLGISGPNAGSFILGQPGVTSLPEGASTTFAISVPETAQHPVGYQTATLHISGDAPANASFDVPLTYSYLARENWRMTHFGSTLNTGDAADLADPTADPELVQLLALSPGHRLLRDEVIDAFAFFGQTTTSVMQTSPVPRRAVSAPRT